MHNRKEVALTALSSIVILAFALTGFAQDKMMKEDKMMAGHHSTQFKGKVVNAGHVIHSKEGSTNVLTLSDDFIVPGSPDPHWQVVDSKGTVYDLGRVKLKGMGASMDMASDKKPEDRLNKQIKLPAYTKDVAKVIIYCAWAEVNLGEASFAKPVK
jgi:hypothetical protein